MNKTELKTRLKVDLDFAVQQKAAEGSVIPQAAVTVEWAVDKSKTAQAFLFMLGSADMVEKRHTFMSRLGAAFGLIESIGLAGPVNHVTFLSEAWKSEQLAVAPSDSDDKVSVLISTILTEGGESMMALIEDSLPGEQHDIQYSVVGENKLLRNFYKGYDFIKGSYARDLNAHKIPADILTLLTDYEPNDAISAVIKMALDDISPHSHTHSVDEWDEVE